MEAEVIDLVDEHSDDECFHLSHESDDEQNRLECEWLLVIDTNVFMNHLQELAAFVTRLSAKGFTSVQFIVPLVVIHELDNLKRTLEYEKVQKIIRFINFHLESNKIVKSDFLFIRANTTPFDNLDESDSIISFSRQNNDDFILKSCLQLKQLRKLIHTKVVLISEDINLRNKALAVGICTYPFKRFTKQILKPELFDIHIFPSRSNPTYKRKKQNIHQSHTNHTHTDPIVITLDENEDIIIDHISLSGDSNEIQSPRQDVINSETDPFHFFFNLIEKVLMHFFGESLWRRIFNKVFMSVTLYDVLIVLNNGWTPLFFHAFNQNSEAKSLIEKLLDKISKGADQNQVKSDASELMKLTIDSSSLHQNIDEVIILDELENKTLRSVRNLEDKPRSNCVQWVVVKRESDHMFKQFLEIWAKEVFGENKWTQNFLLNIKRAKTFDVLNMLKNGWSFVFGNVFKNDFYVKVLLEELVNRWNESTNRNSLKSSILSLLKRLNKLRQTKLK
ncbi:transcriptional protein SWT1-like isoform X1 [Dinothrombium tinctorium]|uniref:Transcriptional protein SWT1-like isoform X1 n=1 Tax=Dinothrombium tinctorium TaxID=1965070 RepID=A0A3S3NCV9_9ACAR|nr:transcriptional protein SWT1-like isoform X1 [Dinothrombium tinctorium]